jgi:pimeloyl-ACP methyl ester carboxylesterase
MQLARTNPSLIRLSTGITVEAVEHGDPDGTPLVALHGVSDSWRSFAPVLPHLPATLRVIAISQRGHGDSDKPVDGYAPRDFAADVAALLDCFALPSAFVLGHSMGATHAMRFALDHPARCRGLLLAGAFARFQDKPDLVTFWRDGVHALVDPVDAQFVRAFQLDTVARPIDAAFIDLVVAESLKLPARVWRAAFDGFMGDAITPELPRIDAPTLLLHGARDIFAPEDDQAALLETIAGARLVRYADAGHALHWEEPARFAADVAAFVSAEVARFELDAEAPDAARRDPPFTSRTPGPSESARPCAGSV